MPDVGLLPGPSERRALPVSHRHNPGVYAQFRVLVV